MLCNPHKGSDVASIDPETGDIVPRFNPRQNRWQEHFRISGERIEALTAIGRATVPLLRLNGAERLAERQLLRELNEQPEF